MAAPTELRTYCSPFAGPCLPATSPSPTGDGTCEIAPSVRRRHRRLDPEAPHLVEVRRAIEEPPADHGRRAVARLTAHGDRGLDRESPRELEGVLAAMG
jgi:hypothetical protein